MNTTTRREFIKAVGITLAGLIMSHCVPATKTPATASPERDAVRAAWLALEDIPQQNRLDNNGQKHIAQLGAEHRQALDRLVEKDELSASAAEQVQTAFDAAAYHIWRSSAPITCYIIGPPLNIVRPVEQLMQQSALLSEFSAGNTLPPETLADIRTTVARDIAFLNLTLEESSALQQAIYESNALEDVAWDLASENIAAARFLVALLLEQ